MLVECPGDREAVAKLGRVHGTTAGHSQPEEPGSWIIPEARGGRLCRQLGPDGLHAPYAPAASSWIKAPAWVVVELGVRFGHSTRAFLEGARAVDGRVWGVDLLERHDVSDERFTFVQADPFKVAARWERINLLHIDIDSQCEGRCSPVAQGIREPVPGHRRTAAIAPPWLSPRTGDCFRTEAATDYRQVFRIYGNVAACRQAVHTTSRKIGRGITDPIQPIDWPKVNGRAAHWMALR